MEYILEVVDPVQQVGRPTERDDDGAKVVVDGHETIIHSKG
jgi:hypothetical protein